MNQLEQDIINSANVKLAGIAKGMLFSALGGATSGGLAGAGLGSLLGGTIGAVKNYRNSAGTFGNRLKAGFTGGLKGGAKGGLIGGGIGAGLGSSAALLKDELNARIMARQAIKQIGNMRVNGRATLGRGFYDDDKALASYLQGLNSNGDNYKHIDLLDRVFGKSYGGEPSLADTVAYFKLKRGGGPDLDILKRDALKKARELNYAYSPLANFSDGSSALSDLLNSSRYTAYSPRKAIENWRMEI